MGSAITGGSCLQKPSPNMLRVSKLTQFYEKNFCAIPEGPLWIVTPQQTTTSASASARNGTYVESDSIYGHHAQLMMVQLSYHPHECVHALLLEPAAAIGTNKTTANVVETLAYVSEHNHWASQNWFN